MLVSQSTARELLDVGQRPKFDRYVKRLERWIAFEDLLAGMIRVSRTSKVHACVDTKDDAFLKLAVDGSADYLVTSDSHLLHLSPFRGVRIVNPAEFLKQIKRT